MGVVDRVANIINDDGLPWTTTAPVGGHGSTERREGVAVAIVPEYNCLNRIPKGGGDNNSKNNKKLPQGHEAVNCGERGRLLNWAV